MPASMYRFTDSASDNAKSDFLRIKGDIESTLNSIADSVNALKNGWEATEADMYFEIINNWQEGAKGLKDVLGSIEQTLGGIQNGNTELRSSISEILDATE